MTGRTLFYILLTDELAISIHRPTEEDVDARRGLRVVVEDGVFKIIPWEKSGGQQIERDPVIVDGKDNPFLHPRARAEIAQALGLEHPVPGTVRLKDLLEEAARDGT